MQSALSIETVAVFNTLVRGANVTVKVAEPDPAIVFGKVIPLIVKNDEPVPDIVVPVIVRELAELVFCIVKVLVNEPLAVTEPKSVLSVVEKVISPFGMVVLLLCTLIVPVCGKEGVSKAPILGVIRVAAA